MIEKSVLSSEELNGIRLYLTKKFAENIEHQKILEKSVLSAKSPDDFDTAMKNLKQNNEEREKLVKEITYYF